MRSTGPDATGSPEAWAPFYRGLRALVARRVPAQDVDDLTQEILLKIHKGADSLRSADRAEAWIRGIARHAIADYYRKRASTAEGEPAGAIEEVADPDPGSRKGFGSFEGTHSVHEEVLTWLRPMAEALPAGYREAILMADFDEIPQKEVARRLGLSLSGAKSRVQRARVMLRQSLRRCCEIHVGADGRIVDFRRRSCDC